MSPSVKGLNFQSFYYRENANKINTSKRENQNINDKVTLKNIDVALVSLLLTLDSTLFFVFHCCIWGVAGWVYQQRLKYRQVKIIKQARTGATYVILTKRIYIYLYIIYIFIYYIYIYTYIYIYLYIFITTSTFWQKISST